MIEPGPVFPGEEQKHVFAVPVTNDRGRPVRITALGASCACSKTSLDKKEFPPGESGTLTLEVNTQGRNGPFRVDCRLETDDPASPVWTYTVQTHIHQRAAFASAGIFLGSADPHQPLAAETSLLLSAPKDAELPRLEAITCTSEQVRLAVQPGQWEEIAGGRQCRVPVKIAFQSDAKSGSFGAELVAKIAGPNPTEARASLTWNVRELFQLAPKIVAFGRIEEGKPAVEKKAILLRTDGKPLKVLRCRSSHPAVTCRVSQLAPGKCMVVLTLQMDQLKDGAFSGEVEVETDHPSKQKPTVVFCGIKR